MVLLSLKAGLRAVEIAGLTWGCVREDDIHPRDLNAEEVAGTLQVSRLFGAWRRRDHDALLEGWEIKPIRYGPLPPEAATPAMTQAIVVLVSIIAIAAIEIVLASEGVAAIAGPAELIAVAWPRPWKPLRACPVSGVCPVSDVVSGIVAGAGTADPIWVISRRASIGCGRE
jgi:hypothetical protein